MKRIIKFLSIFLFVFILLFNSISPTFSQPQDNQNQSATTSPCGSGAEATEEEAAMDQELISNSDFSTNPGAVFIDESLPCVDVTFHGLQDNKDYYLCTGGDDCLGTSKISGDSVLTGDDEKEKSDGEGNVTFRVCGDGENALKIKGCSPKSTDNWFIAENLYTFSAVAKAKDKYQPVRKGGFYVQKSYPKIDIQPNSGLHVPGELKVSLYGMSRGGGEERNNYQLTMKGGEGYEEEVCVNIGETGQFKNIKDHGSYTIFVKEQINEPETVKGMAKDAGGSLVDSVNPLKFVKKKVIAPIKGVVHDLTHPKEIPKDLGNFVIKTATAPFKSVYNFAKGTASVIKGIDNTLFNRCQGGETFWEVTCEFTDSDQPAGKCLPPEKDPKGEEYKAFLKSLSEMNSIAPGAILPCGNGIRTVANSATNCTELQTAIGPIGVSAQGFVETIFKFVLMLAGFGAIIILIYSGYILMTSGGNKEKIAAARETITSAIVGLLFIILSIVILEIIGVDILRIPDLTR